jgi:hypothetical protein
MNDERPLDVYSSRLGPANLERFEKQLESFLKYSWKKHKRHFYWSTATAIAGIVLGSAVVITGALNLGFWAAVLGAAVSVLLGIQNHFKFAERANLWEVKHNDAKGVRDRLRYKVRTDEAFQLLIDDWLALKKGLLDDMPRLSETDGQRVVEKGRVTEGSGTAVARH